MTALVQAEQDGDTLGENELLAMAFLRLVAGRETTVYLIGGGVLALLDPSEQKARLLADWSLAPSAIEELLRFVSSVQFAKPRYVGRDLEFLGQPLRRGDVLVPMPASANADPDRFERPEGMDITGAPNPHIAFGTGKHFCLGAARPGRSAGRHREVVHPVPGPVAGRARFRARVHRKAGRSRAHGAARAVDVRGAVGQEFGSSCRMGALVRVSGLTTSRACGQKRPTRPGRGAHGTRA